ncbi:MAG TPA: DNA gyrase inhibitor YacG [Aestuariivirgaceae bacterium]|jgi:endogenous inhibitor of DNA gyrase (YacG/DUF329 family)
MAKSNPVRLRPRRRCPVCGKPAIQKFHPFCSARCSDIDLGRWLSGNYAIPGENAKESEDAKENGSNKDDE